MKINYKILISDIYKEIINIKKSSIINDNDKKLIIDKIFCNYLKDLFYSTKIELGGHHESYFDGLTVSEILKRDPKSDFIEDIKKSVLLTLNIIVSDVLNSIELNKNYEDIEYFFVNSPCQFTHFSILNNDHCHICGHNSSYYISNGLISQEGQLKETDYNYELVEESTRKFNKLFTNKKFNCPFPNGIDEYEYIMNIKSDKLVISDRLFDLFNIDFIKTNNYISEKSGYPNNINSELGVMYNQEFWNSKGLIYVQTGNTSPNIYKDSVTGTIAAIDTQFKLSRKNKFPFDVSNMKKITNIITDVWAITAMDMNLFKKECKKNNISIENGLSKYNAYIIDIVPGTYKIKSYNAHNYIDKPVFFTISKK